MDSKLVISPHGAAAVYDDRWKPIFQALGPLEVSRETLVEFDNQAQEWVATRIKTGQVIARGNVRAQVIAAEVEYLEREVIR